MDTGPLGDGTRELRNHATGACLQHGDAGLGTRHCDRSAAQRWWLAVGSDDSTRLKNKVTGACLDDSTAAGMRALPCEDRKHQKWA
ncbi:RICIN domain-containing protein [Streptomyces sp. SID1121]|uniref:RICIN domain-containing protein n=1 Tax=Streptomyces sp. SID1121 TaxID=3425888 RepID=UPI004056ABDE